MGGGKISECSPSRGHQGHQRNRKGKIDSVTVEEVMAARDPVTVGAIALVDDLRRLMIESIPATSR